LIIWACSLTATIAIFTAGDISMTDKVLGPFGVKAIEGRNLNPETAARLGLHTAKHHDGEVVPSASGNIMVFPFIEHGLTVNEKYRGPGKKFWQMKGGKRTFFNSDALDDPALYDQGPNGLPLVITEGELDAITAIDAGFPLSVSVPDGAPSPIDPAKPLERLEPGLEARGKFEFLWNNRERLKKVRRFILAVDNDPAGKALEAELLRRLLPSRCYSVAYPEGCKDLNDVLKVYGQRKGLAMVYKILSEAKAYPIKGIYGLSDYPDKPPIQTFETRWEHLRPLFKMFFPSFIVVTGIPNHGKSTFVTDLLINMAETYGFKSAVFSPEMPVVPHLRDKMRRIAGRSALENLSREQVSNLDRWIGEYFVFIDHDVNGDEDEDISLEWILSRAEDAVLRFGVRILVIDPWNEIEHCKAKNETTADYINRALRALKKFGQRHGLCVIVVAHPTKDVGGGKDGKPRVPTLYDVADSAAWFNKPDFGIVVHRSATADQTAIYIAKARFDDTGTKGSCNLKFIRATNRYEQLDYRGQPEFPA
jgi:twinkle protein